MKRLFLIGIALTALGHFVAPASAIEETPTEPSEFETKSVDESPVDTNIEVRKIEVKPTESEVKKIEIEDPTGATKPADPASTYVITKDPEKCKPLPCKTLSLKKEGEAVVIGDGSAEAKTSLPIKIEEDKITVEIGEQQSETIIFPSEAKRIVETRPAVQGPLPTKISKIELTRCEPKPGPEPLCEENSSIYKIEVEKKHKFLGVVSIKSKLNYEISGGDGRLISETKPWYLRLAPFLFGL